MIKRTLPLEKVYVASAAVVVRDFLSAFRTCFVAQKIDFRASYSISRKSAEVLIEFVNQNGSADFDKRLKNEFIVHLDLWKDGELHALKSFVERYFSKNIDYFQGVLFIVKDREWVPYF